PFALCGWREAGRIMWKNIEQGAARPRVTCETLGSVEAVYDRAALVALPRADRARYAAHITAITRGAPQLLVTLVYDQTRADGPPFSVDEQEVRALYGASYGVTLLESADDPAGMKGKFPATEKVWLLS
ncbi:hypothetical protein ACIKTA_16160, partial [Hansschlegelia beijingensis]